MLVVVVVVLVVQVGQRRFKFRNFQPELKSISNIAHVNSTFVEQFERSNYIKFTVHRPIKFNDNDDGGGHGGHADHQQKGASILERTKSGAKKINYDYYLSAVVTFLSKLCRQVAVLSRRSGHKPLSFRLIRATLLKSSLK